MLLNVYLYGTIQLRPQSPWPHLLLYAISQSNAKLNLYRQVKATAKNKKALGARFKL